MLRIQYFDNFDDNGPAYLIWGTCQDMRDFYDAIASSEVLELVTSANGTFIKSTVNIEENGKEKPIRRLAISGATIFELKEKLLGLVDINKSGHNYIDLEGGTTIIVSQDEYPQDFGYAL